MRKPTIWVPTRSDTNRPVQAQKRARSLKFRIKVEEELYYTSSENKGADQLRGYREADLRLCFRLCRLLVFPCSGSHIRFTIRVYPHHTTDRDQFPLACTKYFMIKNKIHLHNCSLLPLNQCQRYVKINEHTKMKRAAS